ncbi:small secreted protein [Streptomyces carminius]|uniref:Small secreted protein n=1 Tax=Streptomyces carminius TaxID=2665496 RepID=A0A2M8LWP7_9ACTN|nr:small secreted protein [Streptomyces carminius]PJE96386.1 small secreted protein [Streptomyces carminius]
MNKKLAIALTGGTALVLALSGCGGDGEDKTAAWAQKFCDQVQPQVKRIQQANASITQATEGEKPPEEIKTTDAQAFSDISRAYAALAKAVKGAGTPPVEDGAALEKDAVRQLDGMSRKYADLKKQADALNTEDQAEFADGLKEIADGLGRLNEGGDQALEKLQKGELGKAMAEQKGCRKPAPSPSASAA